MQCGPDGLFAASAQVAAVAAEAVTVTGDGSLASPFEIGLKLDPTGSNLASQSAAGLLVSPNPHQIVEHGILAGTLPAANAVFYDVFGSYVGTSNSLGHITVPIAQALDGIGAIIPVLGDRPVVHTEMNLDQASVGLGTFDVVVEDADTYGTPISGGSYRINYVVKGWKNP